MYFAFANCMRAVSSALNKRLLLRMTTIASGLACFEIPVDKYVRLPGRLDDRNVTLCGLLLDPALKLAGVFGREARRRICLIGARIGSTELFSDGAIEER
jgi:hypothetical protein